MALKFKVSNVFGPAAAGKSYPLAAIVSSWPMGGKVVVCSYLDYNLMVVGLYLAICALPEKIGDRLIFNSSNPIDRAWTTLNIHFQRSWSVCDLKTPVRVWKTGSLDPIYEYLLQEMQS